MTWAKIALQEGNSLLPRGRDPSDQLQEITADRKTTGLRNRLCASGILLSSKQSSVKGKVLTTNSTLELKKQKPSDCTDTSYFLVSRVFFRIFLFLFLFRKQKTNYFVALQTNQIALEGLFAFFDVIGSFTENVSDERSDWLA